MDRVKVFGRTGFEVEFDDLKSSKPKLRTITRQSRLLLSVYYTGAGTSQPGDLAVTSMSPRSTRPVDDAEEM